MDDWTRYVEHVKKTDPIGKAIIEEAERDARQISSFIHRREELGLSDRDITRLIRARNVSAEAGRLKKRLHRRAAISRLFARFGARPRAAAK